MSLQNVDTFEHDIADEIKNKEASIADIVSASGDVSNTPTQQQKSSLIFILGGFFIALVIAVLGGFIWYTLRAKPTVSQAPTNSLPVIPKASLTGLSPTLADAIGDNVSSLKKGDYGYTLSLASYTPVFAYMLKNENDYVPELAFAFGFPKDTATTTTPFVFTDVTLNNQNMRVGVSGSSTIAYAFVNGTTLLLATSTDGILALRSDILR
jgi:hypothetical protein